MKIVKTNLLTRKKKVIYRGIKGGFFVRKANGLKRYGIKAAYRVVNGRKVPIQIITKSIPKPLISHKIALEHRMRKSTPRPMMSVRPMVSVRPMRPMVVPVRPQIIKPMAIPMVKKTMENIRVERADAPKSIIVTHDTIPKNRENRISLMANSLVREKQKV